MEDSCMDQKVELRKKLQIKRASLELKDRNRMDEAIFQNLISMTEFKSCSILLTYVSMGDEINTRDIIDFAIKAGKKVAVPHTDPANKIMEFYEITSLDELRPGKYGILEPDADPDKRIWNPFGALCLVPGLSFDFTGNRIGYGGGYYDRYLKEFSGITVGLCRSILFSLEKLPHEFHDVPVGQIVMEEEIIKIKYD